MASEGGKARQGKGKGNGEKGMGQLFRVISYCRPLVIPFETRPKRPHFLKSRQNTGTSLGHFCLVRNSEKNKGNVVVIIIIIIIIIITKERSTVVTVTHDEVEVEVEVACQSVHVHVVVESQQRLPSAIIAIDAVQVTHTHRYWCLNDRSIPGQRLCLAYPTPDPPESFVRGNSLS